MIRWLLLFSLSGCGLAIDGAYLLSDRHTHKTVEQRKPTGLTDHTPERRLAFEGTQIRVACEEVTRGVDRVWTVDKDYENQGGYYQAHWVPVLLEGLIGAALAIGIGIKCQDPASKISCNLLYGTIPFGIDVSYSLVRLLTINPPKLVNKTAGPPRTEHHGEPSARVPIACDSETTIIGSGSPQLRIQTGPEGELTPEDQQQLVGYALKHPNAQLSLFSGTKQVSADQDRCTFFRSLGAANPVAPMPPECARR